MMKSPSKTSRMRLQQFKLPNLKSSKNMPQTSLFNKRFSSVKARGRIDQTQSQNQEIDSVEENKLPTSFSTIAEALPFAINRKQKMLEKTEEDDDLNVKKLIKVRSPKEYHGQGLATHELLTGKLPETSNPKIVYGKSYVISISPSQKNYEKKKRYFEKPSLIQKK